MAEPTLTPAAFASKWKGVETSEKASAQSHFIDLCRMLGEPTPHEADPTGSAYAFEKRVVKAGGGDGYADVWKRDFFAWEYKGKYKDLRAAYVQLLGYKDDLGNPPRRALARSSSSRLRSNGAQTPHLGVDVDLPEASGGWCPSRSLAEDSS